MALFGSKKEKAEKVPDAIPALESTRKAATSKGEIPAGRLQGVLLRPRITEKATDESQRGVYVFEVAPRATKTDIAAAVQQFYNVKPVKVRVMGIPYKQVSSKVRGKYGTAGGGKKAYVYLAEGDRIEFV
jgi:large subunit ribosomal protein L23